MAVAPDVTLNGKIATATSFDLGQGESQPELGGYEIALCGYGPQIPKVEGEALFGRVTSSEGSTDSDGHFEVMLYSNGLINPAGTYYTITIKDSNGDIVQTEAYTFQPGQWDLSNMQPFDPTGPPPPIPPTILDLLLVVPYSSAPTFPGDQFQSWQITLNGDATASFTNLVDGNLYTIIIVQDGSGNHKFNWPANVFNYTFVNPNANGMTIQTFVAVSNLLYPIGAGTFYP